MKIRVHVELGLHGCKSDTVIDVPDDSDDDDIRAEAEQVLFEMLSWGYEKLGQEGQ